MSGAAVRIVNTATTMSLVEAKAITEKIRRAADELWRLLLDAYEREAWRPLGYTSWRDYTAAEFSIGQSHAYRLLDQGRIVRAIEATAGVSPVGGIVSERAARGLKPHLREVTSEIRARIEAGENPSDVVANVVGTARSDRFSYADSRKGADRSNRIISRIALAAENIVDDTNLVDFSMLDRSCTNRWAAEMRTAAKQLSQLAKRLESLGGGR